MLVRQKVIIHLIDKMGGESSFIRLTKTAFLYKRLVKSNKNDTFYDFVPYKYGPYSFNLHNELKKLIKNRYLYSLDKKTVRINNNLAIPSIDLQFEEQLRFFINKYSNLSDNKLSEHIYSQYPWFTINAAKIENVDPCAQRLLTWYILLVMKVYK